MKGSKSLEMKMLNVFLASHHGVISREQAGSLGITAHQIDWRLRCGQWAALHRGVYRLVGTEVGPEGLLLAACIAAGPLAVASHRSAAWLWGLLPGAPAAPELTTAASGRPTVRGVVLHRHNDIDETRILVHRGVPVTDPVRTLADLGEVVDAGDLDEAVDRALAAKLLTVDALTAEVARLGRRGRTGVSGLRGALVRRGLVGAPSPSVLESRVHRLLAAWGIVPAGVEVVACDGRYRLDVLLVPGLALEVDGYAFHWSPEAKAADSRRRNELARAGIHVIEADWVTVVRHPDQLRATVLAALEDYGVAPPRLRLHRGGADAVDARSAPASQALR